MTVHREIRLTIVCDTCGRTGRRANGCSHFHTTRQAREHLGSPRDDAWTIEPGRVLCPWCRKASA